MGIEVDLFIYDPIMSASSGFANAEGRSSSVLIRYPLYGIIRVSSTGASDKRREVLTEESTQYGRYDKRH